MREAGARIFLGSALPTSCYSIRQRCKDSVKTFISSIIDGSRNSVYNTSKLASMEPQ
jgi:hypothetical protein